MSRRVSMGGTNLSAVYAASGGSWWTWANAAARAATPVSADQIGMVGYQTDMALRYRLISQSGGVGRWSRLSWEDVGFVHTARARPGDAIMETCGYGCVVTTGTLTAVTPSSTTKSLQLFRAAAVTAAGAGSTALFRGSASGLFGAVTGLRWSVRVVLETVAAGYRWYAGSTPSIFTANIDPATLLNCFGMGRGNGESNVQIYYNDGAGAATQVDLGASFPAATAGSGYGLEVYSPDGSSYSYQATNLDSGAQVSGTVSTNIPGSGAINLFEVYCSNNATASAVSISMAGLDLAQLVA